MPQHDLPLPPWLLPLIAALDVGSLVVWIVVAWKSWIRFQPRRPVPWNGIDLAAVVLLVVLCWQTEDVLLPHVYGGPPPKQLNSTTLASGCATELAALALGIAWLMIRARATLADLGLSGSRFGYFVGLGILAYLVSVTPIQSLLEAVSKLFNQPYEHEVIKALLGSGGSSLWIWAGLMVVVVGPICEEMFFRVALQGWLETLAWPGATGSMATRAEIGPPDAPPVEPVVWWPIVLSSAAFALMHLGQGLAPIPLFFFALVLGYLYQRTHRLWPSLVAHMLLNGGSVAMLWILLHVQKVPVG